jgi:hypothetical protein
MIGKPIASLSSGLLARKGQARPAMRPQGFVGMNPAPSVDDLGWNDMGDGMAAHAPRPVPVGPMPTVQIGKPVVLRQLEALDEQIAQSPAPLPEPVAPKPAPRPVPIEIKAVPEGALVRVAREVAAKKGKAAFTLRLDQDRHLRLRLASAVSGRSAQHLVTQALDQFLATLDEVEALAVQLGPVTDNA